MKDNKTYDVFMSYRRDGAMETVMLLSRSLEERGYHVFLDIESLRSGLFNEKLYEMIDQCEDFILVLPPRGLDRCSSEKDWVRLEIEHAHASGKNIVPVWLRDFDYPDELPESLIFLRYQNGIKASFDFYDAFVEKLTKFLHSTPTPEPEPLPSPAPAPVPAPPPTPEPEPAHGSAPPPFYRRFFVELLILVLCAAAYFGYRFFAQTYEKETHASTAILNSAESAEPPDLTNFNIGTEMQNGTQEEEKTHTGISELGDLPLK